MQYTKEKLLQLEKELILETQIRKVKYLSCKTLLIAIKKQLKEFRK